MIQQLLSELSKCCTSFDHSKDNANEVKTGGNGSALTIPTPVYRLGTISEKFSEDPDIGNHKIISMLEDFEQNNELIYAPLIDMEEDHY